LEKMEIEKQIIGIDGEKLRLRRKIHAFILYY